MLKGAIADLLLVVAVGVALAVYLEPRKGRTEGVQLR
jgi:hypothetical protein